MEQLKKDTRACYPVATTTALPNNPVALVRQAANQGRQSSHHMSLHDKERDHQFVVNDSSRSQRGIKDLKKAAAEAKTKATAEEQAKLDAEMKL